MKIRTEEGGSSFEKFHRVKSPKVGYREKRCEEGQRGMIKEFHFVIILN